MSKNKDEKEYDEMNYSRLNLLRYSNIYVTEKGRFNRSTVVYSKLCILSISGINLLCRIFAFSELSCLLIALSPSNFKRFILRYSK